ncbi:MAG TPA: hypothetical protein VII20_23315 [Roseiarcus sp.]|jgi:hypothetical protein
MQEPTMKRLSLAMSTLVLCVCAAAAQSAKPPGDADGKPINITANFQMRIPIDASASMADVTKALTQANQSLGDLANRECDLLTDAFKSDCRVVQLNMGANVNDRRGMQQFNNDFGGMQRSVNANLNATYELTSQADAAKNPAAAK